MAREIERKFLVSDQSWREHWTKSERLIDGLLAISDERKVRVRIYERRATITVKTRRTGAAREEFEYMIPVEDARELIACHCDGNVLEKVRHYVPYQGFVWEVDVYEGILSGMILAEVELENADIEVLLPHWIGREVTADPEYKKINMRNKALQRRGNAGL
jgi:CYTH domain-containing protein